MTTANEISMQMDTKDGEILKCSEYLDLVAEQIHKLKREIVSKELELDDLKQQYKKGRFNLGKLRTEKELLDRAHWRQLKAERGY